MPQDLVASGAVPMDTGGRTYLLLPQGQPMAADPHGGQKGHAMGTPVSDWGQLSAWSTEDLARCWPLGTGAFCEPSSLTQHMLRVLVCCYSRQPLPRRHRQGRRRTLHAQEKQTRGSGHIVNTNASFHTGQKDRCRIGEAKVPGPLTKHWRTRQFQLVPMSGDGQCLYHAIGYHTSAGVQDVRGAMLRHLRDQPSLFTDIDAQGHIGREAAAQLRDPHSWGGALQIHIAAHRWNCTIHVHSTNMRTQAFGNGPTQWHLAYHSGQGVHHKANHYDVLVPIAPDLGPGPIGHTQGPEERPREAPQGDSFGAPSTQSTLKRKIKMKAGELKILTANIGGPASVFCTYAPCLLT